ncbi:MAG: MetS family NSS transporter small subunit [Actinomycetota bacterium]|nr:MetS family NSS transporter small subunit [Actinomycetota bacterium]
MSAGAWIMLLCGAIVLWGGLAFFVAYYLRAGRRG